MIFRIIKDQYGLRIEPVDSYAREKWELEFPSTKGHNKHAAFPCNSAKMQIENIRAAFRWILDVFGTKVKVKVDV